MARILGSMKRFAAILILLLAFCGLADSAYVAQAVLSGVSLICNANNLYNCVTVAHSSSAYLFGIPLAEYGVLFYGVLFTLAALELVLFDRILRRALQWLSFAGVLAAIWFSFIQVWFVGVFCTYCAISGVITILVLVGASLLEPLRTHTKVPPPRTLVMPPKG